MRLEEIAESESVQTASADFFIPIAGAYLVACGCWFLVKRFAGERWEEEEAPVTDRKWIDLAMIFIAMAGVFGIGAAYRAGWLLPPLTGSIGQWVAAVNLCLPYSAIFIGLAIRGQSLNTAWISGKAIGWKIGTGLLAALAGLFVFYLLRNDLESLVDVFPKSMTSRALLHAPAVFLEAVAVAFIFVRLRWIVGPVVAILIPCLLFALGHVPTGIESGRSLFELIAFFVFNTALAAAIFSTVMRSRDVIWIFIPHYFLDVAIEAFG